MLRVDARMFYEALKTACSLSALALVPPVRAGGSFLSPRFLGRLDKLLKCKLLSASLNCQSNDLRACHLAELRGEINLYQFLWSRPKMHPF